MLIQDLFEKTEQAQYKLINYLLDREKSVHLKDIIEFMGISRATLLKYIEGINMNFNLSNLLEIFYVEDKVELKIQDQVSLERITEAFTKDSIKFQISEYLLHNSEFTIPSLALKLSISEATLNRHLSALNKILEEFNISIRNGKLHGSELQIRYYYFQLLTKTHTQDSLEKMNIDKISKLITLLEENYISNFNAKQHMQIVVSIYIFQLRLKVKNKNFTSVNKLMIPFKNHKIYMKLKADLSTFIKGLEEGDVMCLFAFLSSKSILSAPMSEQILGYGGPLTEATTVGIQCIKTLPLREYQLNEQAMYSLSQLLGHMYFFTGYLIRRPVVIAENGMNIYKDRVDNMFTHIMNNLYKQEGKYSLHQREVFDKKMLNIFSYLLENASSVLKIAVKLSGDELNNYLLMKRLRQELELNRLIFLEWYEEGKKYDYLITDFIEKNNTSNVYCLKNNGRGQDIKRIKKILQEKMSNSL